MRSQRKKWVTLTLRETRFGTWAAACVLDGEHHEFVRSEKCDAAIEALAWLSKHRNICVAKIFEEPLPLGAIRHGIGVDQPLLTLTTSFH